MKISLKWKFALLLIIIVIPTVFILIQVRDAVQLAEVQARNTEKRSFEAYTHSVKMRYILDDIMRKTEDVAFTGEKTLFIDIDNENNTFNSHAENLKNSLTSEISKKKLFKTIQVYKRFYIESRGLAIFLLEDESIVYSQARFDETERRAQVVSSLRKKVIEQLEQQMLSTKLEARRSLKLTVQEIQKSSELSGKVGIIALFMISLFSIVLLRSIIRPITKLSLALKQVTDGNFKTSIKRYSNDEIGDLTSAFNLMSSEINEKQLSLQNAKSYTDNIISSMSDILIVLSPVGVIGSINSSAVELLGYQQTDLVAKNFGFVMGKPEQPFGNTSLVGLVDVEKGALKDYELNFIHKSGEEIPVSITASAMRNAAGGLVGIVVTGRDIRESRYVLELLSANNQLKEKEEKIIFFQTQLIETSKMASLGDMSAGIAHELNQPLGAVLLNSHIIIKLIEKGEFERVKEICETIKGQVLRAKKITDALRVFSRKDIDVELQNVDINLIVDDVITLFAEEFKLSKIRLELQLSADELLVYVSSVQIGQVLTNLIINARDAVDKVSEKTIKIISRLSDGHVQLRVEDNGHGIEEDVLDHIFEPFYTTKSVGKGTGLGLSLSYSMMKDNGGEIVVESELSEGTTVTLLIPQAERV